MAISAAGIINPSISMVLCVCRLVKTWSGCALAVPVKPSSGTNTSEEGCINLDLNIILFTPLKQLIELSVVVLGCRSELITWHCIKCINKFKSPFYATKYYANSVPTKLFNFKGLRRFCALLWCAFEMVGS